MTWFKRDRPGRTTTEADPDSLLAAVTSATHAAARGGWESWERLVDVLADVDAAGDESLARTALGVVVESPGTVIGLDWHVRQVPWHSPHYPSVLSRLASRIASAPAGPIAIAAASMHGDGHVREQAVAAISSRPVAELVPFLVLRTADWVTQVRDRARAALALLLTGEPDTYLPSALPTTLAIQSRLRSGFARTQTLAALLSASGETRRSLVAATDRRLGRFVFDIGLGQHWWPLPDLVVAAESDSDVRIRVQAAEAVCRQAVWTHRVELLRRLAGSRRTEVRAYAVIGLVRAGLRQEAATWLNDGSSLVRATARDAARHHGVDILGHYRAAVTNTEQIEPGAIDGLAEVGSATDAALLRPLLAHPFGKIRSHAVRASRQLDAVDIDDVATLLRDPSPAVVREAVLALLPLQRRLPEALPWQLLDDPRPYVRRAGYRLLRQQATAIWLRAALILTADPDPDLARRGLADATGLARSAALPRSRRTTRPELDVTTAERAELVALVEQAAQSLGEDTARLLTGWLASTTSAWVPGG